MILRRVRFIRHQAGVMANGCSGRVPASCEGAPGPVLCDRMQSTHNRRVGVRVYIGGRTPADKTKSERGCNTPGEYYISLYP